MTDKSDSKLKAKGQPTVKNEIWETVVVLLQALLIALVFRSFLFQPFSIPTASLQSNLLIGDYILTSKYTYGYSKYSFPFEIIPMSGRLFGRAPEQGEIAVFRPVPQSVDYVKRVVGLPGDTVQMKNGVLHINGTAVKKERVGTLIDTDSYGVSIPVIQYRETLPNGSSYIVQEISDNQALDNTAEYKVPAGHYFMMGDNRDRSADSRVLRSVGYVPLENFIGKAEVRFFSIKDNINPWQIWRWPGNVRLDRMFQSVYQ
ncbi:signal peptidase I [Maritalea porphyrae]|jgi:signal peptidase I|uniref:signal peptidase I n=1 Tax=Maritalea porphyrae TaxID=880732 RepID=UPI0022AEA485|nr:signal peptidase I [Maritalea porphyrae]MCZ4270847.1 signal peptidase I [Maritalea porphyrae]